VVPGATGFTVALFISRLLKRRDEMFRKISIYAALILLLALISVNVAGAKNRGNLTSAPLFAATGTAFTYQGYLEDQGSPATGLYDFEFNLYDDPDTGVQVGPTVIKGDVSVSSGFFTVDLDFGAVFDGTAYWLEIGVRPGASTGGFTGLTPRQAITAVPYAITALNLPVHDHFGETWTDTGTGLSLISTDTTGFVNGLWAESASDGGNGIYGYATSTTGPAWGVVGESDADEGIGVYGGANSLTGETFGVWGEVASTTDYASGVYGYAYGSSGYTSGVVGVTDSTQGIGVVGFTPADSGYTTGVYGETSSPDGIGIYGYASSNSTSGIPIGVYGVNSSSSGWGVYAEGDLGASGNLYVFGGTKSAVVNTQDYGTRELYSVESPEVWFEDFGTATISAGSAEVVFEPIFAQTVNFAAGYHVFLTPLGDCGLYVSGKTESGFTVAALDGSSCTIEFDYRIVAKRIGFEDVRLEPAKTDMDAEASPARADQAGSTIIELKRPTAKEK
jgi:hypothetical protein